MKPKLFYQEGSIKVIVQEDGQRKEIELHPVTCTYIRQNAAFSSSFRSFDGAGNRAAGKKVYGRLTLVLR
jgi:hypothetical protein